MRIAEEAGIEIEMETELDEDTTVTVELEQVPWDQALHNVLRINGLQAEELESGHWVVSRVEGRGLHRSSSD